MMQVSGSVSAPQAMGELAPEAAAQAERASTPDGTNSPDVGAASTSSAYDDATAEEHRDVGMVITAAKRIEHVLRTDFKAQGNGINDMLASIPRDIIGPYTARRLRDMAALRNKLAHSHRLQIGIGIGRNQFADQVADILADLDTCSKRLRSLTKEQTTLRTIFGGRSFNTLNAIAAAQRQHPALASLGPPVSAASSGGAASGGGGGGGGSTNVEASFGGETATGTGASGDAGWRAGQAARQSTSAPRAPQKPAPDIKDSANFPSLERAKAAAGGGGSALVVPPGGPEKERKPDITPKSLVIGGRGTVSTVEETKVVKSSRFYMEKIRDAMAPSAAEAAAAKLAAGGSSDAPRKKTFCQVAFDGRGLPAGPSAASKGAEAGRASRKAAAAAAAGGSTWHVAGKKKNVRAKEHWYLPGVVFNQGVCRGWFPSAVDWTESGAPCMSFASVRLTAGSRSGPALAFAEKSPEEEIFDREMREAVEKSRIQSEMEYLQRNTWLQRFRDRSSGGTSATVAATPDEDNSEAELQRVIELSRRAQREERQRDLRLEREYFAQRGNGSSVGTGMPHTSFDNPSGADGDGGLAGSDAEDGQVVEEMDEELARALEASKADAAAHRQLDGGASEEDAALLAVLEASKREAAAAARAAAAQEEEIKRALAESLRLTGAAGFPAEGPVQRMQPSGPPPLLSSSASSNAARQRLSGADTFAAFKPEGAARRAAQEVSSSEESLESESSEEESEDEEAASELSETEAPNSQPPPARDASTTAAASSSPSVALEAADEGSGGVGSAAASGEDWNDVEDDVEACRRYFPQQLEQLTDLGLAGVRRCASALRAAGGNAERAIEALLSEPEQEAEAPVPARDAPAAATTAALARQPPSSSLPPPPADWFTQQPSLQQPASAQHGQLLQEDWSVLHEQVVYVPLPQAPSQQRAPAPASFRHHPPAGAASVSPPQPSLDWHSVATPPGVAPPSAVAAGGAHVQPVAYGASFDGGMTWQVVGGGGTGASPVQMRVAGPGALEQQQQRRRSQQSP